LELFVEMPWCCEIDAALPVTYAVVGVEDRNAFFALFYGTEGFACLICDD
jgi:hypothetical protein